MSDTETDWYGPETATFGDRVAAAREQSGMTQGQLARRIGVKTSTLRGWEDDLSEPRANKLTMLAGMLNVSVIWLLTGEGAGVTQPREDDPAPHGLDEVLHELREIRAEMHSNIERAGRLEKKLKILMAQMAQGAA